MQVVDALNEGAARIPYRDSKLTRLLQDSLGGDARACILANIAPSKQLYFDTYNSLNFASKSRNIVNRPVVHQTINAPQVARSAPITLQSALTTTATNQSGGAPSRLLSGAQTVSSRPVDSSHSTSANAGAPAKLSLERTAPSKLSSDSSLAKTRPDIKSIQPVAANTQAKKSAESASIYNLMTPASKAEIAKKFIDRAMTLKNDNKKDDALRCLKSALELCPNVKRIADEIHLLEISMATSAVVLSKPALATKKALFSTAPAPLTDTTNVVKNISKKTPEKTKRSQIINESEDGSDDEIVIRGGSRKIKRRRMSEMDSSFNIVCENTWAAGDDSEEDTDPHPALDPEARLQFENRALVFINGNDAKKLVKLKGIGRKKAEMIADYVALHGPFTSVRQNYWHRFRQFTMICSSTA